MTSNRCLCFGSTIPFCWGVYGHVLWCTISLLWSNDWHEDSRKSESLSVLMILMCFWDWFCASFMNIVKCMRVCVFVFHKVSPSGAAHIIHYCEGPQRSTWINSNTDMILVWLEGNDKRCCLAKGQISQGTKSEELILISDTLRCDEKHAQTLMPKITRIFSKMSYICFIYWNKGRCFQLV